METINEIERASKVLTHGVVKQDQVETEFEYFLESFYRTGFAIIPSILTEEELDYTRKALTHVYETQKDEIGGDTKLREINDHNIVRALAAYDDFFLFKIAINEKIRPFLDRILGESYVLSSQVGVFNHPQDRLYQLAWHRELQYQHFTSSRPLAIQTLFCIDDFNADTGGTFLLPYSQHFESFPSDRFVREHQIQVNARAGSVVLFNSMVYHRAGHNTSSSIRRLITNLYTAPIIAQQINISNMLNGRFSNDPFLAKLLGYRWTPSESVKKWREDHISAKSAARK